MTGLGTDAKFANGFWQAMGWTARKLPVANTRSRCIAEVPTAPLQTFNLNVSIPVPMHSRQLCVVHLGLLGCGKFIRGDGRRSAVMH